MKRKLIPAILIFVVAITGSCSGSLESKARSKVLGLRQNAELGTVEYVLNTVIRNEDAFAEALKPGKRKILYSCTAYLKAGIDLRDFDIDDVRVDEGTKAASVTLPGAKLLSLNIPEEEIELVYSHVGFFRSEFSPEERHMMKMKAEDDINRRVRELGICEEAEENARRIIEMLLEPLGFSKVSINFK